MLLLLLPICLLLEIPQLSYFIAIKKNEGAGFNALNSYIPLLPPNGRYYADPFLFKYEGVNYLFFEDYNYKKGVISYVILDQNSAILEPKLALELPIHLSFPYLFEDEGTIYMIPETFQYRKVSLYKSISFPDQWAHEKILVRGENFSDPILFRYHGYYWLFASIHGDRLVIYFAKDLKSQFVPHPINRKSIRGRNGGSIFFIGERLIRPVMDCEEMYGRSVFLKEIVLLTPESFEELEIAHIEPTWAPNLVGTHTYCQGEDYIVYDGSCLSN
jgi:hypothetical protein